jgi:hypothetical protein
MKNVSSTRRRSCSRRIATTRAAPPATSSVMKTAPSQRNMRCRGPGSVKPIDNHQDASETTAPSQTSAMT